MLVYFWSTVLEIVLWGLVRPWFSIMPPFFINGLLKWSTARDRGEEAERITATLYIAGLFLSIVAKTLCHSQALTISRRMEVRVKALLATEVYTKILRRKEVIHEATEGKDKQSKKYNHASTGKAQNIVNVDIDRSKFSLKVSQLMSGDLKPS